MRTSPSYTASYRLEVDEANLSVSQIVDAVSATGAQIKGLDVADSDRGRIVIDLTCPRFLCVTVTTFPAHTPPVLHVSAQRFMTRLLRPTC